MNTKYGSLILVFGLLGLTMALLGFHAAGASAVAAEVSAPSAEVSALLAEITVCPAGPPDCDYAVIQDAVDAALEGDVIKVATGVYTDLHGRPSPPGYEGPEVITQVVYISKTITIRGGYSAPDFSDPPDPEANPTVLNAQGQGRVLCIVGNTSPSVEWLSIAEGDATGLGGEWGFPSYTDGGGGIYIFTATATISNNQVFNNTGASYGGGLYLNFSNAVIRGNIVSANTASKSGGGMYVWHGAATISGNTFSANTIPINGYGGGGLFLHSDNSTVSNNIFSANTVNDGGGGGLFLYGSSALLDRNTVFSNIAAGTGGGVKLYFGDATLNGNLIVGNSAGGISWSSGGGGVYLQESNATLTGNTISLNTANLANGGGLHLDDSHAMLNGNTIVSNTAAMAGGGLFLLWSDALLSNNVVADNQAVDEGSGMYIQGSSPQIQHTTIARNNGGGDSGIYVNSGWGRDSDVVLTNTILISHAVGLHVDTENTAVLEATLWGNGTDWAGDGTILTGTVNMWGPPAFVAPDAGDYHVSIGSAAVDVGVNAGVNVDIDGEPRPMGIGYDIGADELFLGPRLAITKRASDDPVQSGTQLTYTLYVTNTGTVSLTATITDVLPEQVTPGGLLVWTPAPLWPEEVWTETVVVTVDTGYAGLLTNIVQATTEEGATGVYTNVVTVEEIIIDSLAIYLPLVSNNR
jgi:uncharacterized repeat protein (TIGR01451 family)